MSVKIKGMHMPHMCCECRFHSTYADLSHYCRMSATWIKDIRSERPDFCMLEEDE